MCLESSEAGQNPIGRLGCRIPMIHRFDPVTLAEISPRCVQCWSILFRLAAQRRADLRLSSFERFKSANTSAASIHVERFRSADVACIPVSARARDSAATSAEAPAKAMAKAKSRARQHWAYHWAYRAVSCRPSADGASGSRRIRSARLSPVLCAALARYSARDCRRDPCFVSLRC